MTRNKANRRGKTSSPAPEEIRAFMRAAEDGKAQELAAWLERHGTGNVDVRDENGRTALVWASCELRNDSMRLLLEAGADPDAVANNAMTPLAGSIMRGNSAGIALLASYGADLERKFGNDAPVHMAFGWMVPEVLVTLVKQGADIDVRDAKGLTVIEAARADNGKFGFDKVLPFLMEESARRAGLAAAKDVQAGLSAPVRPMKKIVFGPR